MFASCQVPDSVITTSWMYIISYLKDIVNSILNGVLFCSSLYGVPVDYTEKNYQDILTKHILSCPVGESKSHDMIK